MHNLIAFYSSVAQNAALATVTPVTDPLVTVQNNRFVFPYRANIGCILANVPSGTRCRVNTPSLRTIALPEVYPIKTSAANGANPPLDGPCWDTMVIPQNDEFAIEVSRGGAGAADCCVGVWFGMQRVAAPSGPVITLRATSAITLTAGTWVLGNLAFDQSLPYGNYAIVGMDARITNGMLARLTFPGNTQYRPGTPCIETVGDYVNPQLFRNGNFGSFGMFNSSAQPGIEVLGYAAGAQTGVFLLDLVKTG